MKLSEKLALYRNRSLTADAQISAADLSNFGISGPSIKNLQGLLFESSVKMLSPKTGPAADFFIGTQSYMMDTGYIRGCVFMGRYVSI